MFIIIVVIVVVVVVVVVVVLLYRGYNKKDYQCEGKHVVLLLPWQLL